MLYCGGLCLDKVEKGAQILTTRPGRYSQYLPGQDNQSSEVMRSKERSNMECDQEDLLQNESVFSADESITSIDENTRLRDETALLKDKVAHLQSQLEETESKSIIAAELGQRLLEERASLEAMREDDRNMYTAKIEVKYSSCWV